MSTIELPIQIQLLYQLPEIKSIEVLSGGLINYTYKITTVEQEYIFQKINTNVFPQPEKIDENLRLLAQFFHDYFPQYLFVAPIATIQHKTIIEIEGNYYRLFPFIKGTHTNSILLSSNEAYEAAKQFCQFTALLATFPVNKCHVSIPFFHHLSFRYCQMQPAWQNANTAKKKAATALMQKVVDNYKIVQQFNDFIHKNNCIQRVMLHDAKISNVWLNERNEGVAVIDFDTTMPGYFFSDMRDLMRTYLCPVSEQETDFSLIEVRKEYWQAIYEGYLEHMDVVLTSFEKEHLMYSGQIITYMQALRFLTDYLQNNHYYACAYPEQNLNRAINQFHLFEKMQLQSFIF
jgi:Ser/Thr protein kinase RdoA (MazF antagonist)